MASSLSLVLAVHNGAAELHSRVVEMFELLAELTPRFELLVVDDGSTDTTEETAHEISREYPQMRVVRHDSRQGAMAAGETAMRHTEGEFVIVQDLLEPTRVGDLKRLWNLRHRHDSLMAHRQAPDSPASPSLMDRIQSWQSDQQPYAPVGMQLIRREAVDRRCVPPSEETARENYRLRADAADEQRSPKYLTRIRDFAVGE